MPSICSFATKILWFKSIQVDHFAVLEVGSLKFVSWTKIRVEGPGIRQGHGRGRARLGQGQNRCRAGAEQGLVTATAGGGQKQGQSKGQGQVRAVHTWLVTS